VLEDKYLSRIADFHLFHQCLEIVPVCFIGLSTGLDELHLFTAEPADANRTGKVVAEIPLLPLEGYINNRTGVTLTLSPFFAYA